MTDRYRFARFELAVPERQLTIAGEPAAIGARAFDLLLALLERRDRVVAKSELLDLVWPGLVVEENNLQVQVSALRKLLGADVIATIAGRGYRFTARLLAQATGLAAGGAQPAAPPTNLPQPRTRFIGREAALADCARLLATSRLITLSGIGGCGKTRLAQELARQQLDAFRRRRLVCRPGAAPGRRTRRRRRRGDARRCRHRRRLARVPPGRACGAAISACRGRESCRAL